VILPYLKRETESFLLFVPLRYCVPARKFFGVPGRLHATFAKSPSFFKNERTTVFSEEFEYFLYFHKANECGRTISEKKIEILNAFPFKHLR
jgi:hypothetical protein